MQTELTGLDLIDAAREELARTAASGPVPRYPALMVARAMIIAQNDLRNLSEISAKETQLCAAIGVASFADLKLAIRGSDALQSAEQLELLRDYTALVADAQTR